MPQTRLEPTTPQYEVKNSTDELILSVIDSMGVKMIKLPAIPKVCNYITSDPQYEVKNSTNELISSVIGSMAVKMIKLPAIPKVCNYITSDPSI